VVGASRARSSSRTDLRSRDALGELDAKLTGTDTLMKSATCENVRAMVGKPQPNPDLTALLPTEGSHVEDIDTNELQFVTRGELRKDLGADLKAKHDAFVALLGKFDTELPVAQRKKDKPWPAAQAKYIAALSDAWCALADEQRIALEDHKRMLRDTQRELQKAGDTDPLVEHAKAIETALRAGTQTNPVVIPDKLEKDLTFPTTQIRAVDAACLTVTRCRSRRSRSRRTDE
jgi:hypothetical protein